MSNRRELVFDGCHTGRYLVGTFGPWFPDDLPSPLELKGRTYVVQKRLGNLMRERYYGTEWFSLWEHGTGGGDCVVDWVLHGEQLFARKTGPAGVDRWEKLDADPA